MDVLRLDLNKKHWFTSDLHFGHRNVIKFCGRPFIDIKEMGEMLIKNWNDCVAKDDNIFVLGDVFWFNDRSSIKKVLRKLNGNIYVIPGNHDDCRVWRTVLSEDKELATRVHLMDSVTVLRFDYGELANVLEVFLCHYPLMTWPHRDNKSVNLFGHIHSKEGSTGFDKDLPLWEYQYDVGVDNNNYKPIEIVDILEKIKWGKLWTNDN